MKIVEINSVNRYSTGKIMSAISKAAQERGHAVLRCYPDSRTNSLSREKNDISIGNRYYRFFWNTISRYINCEYIAHYIATLLFVRRLRKFAPDIIHIHNLHSAYLNLPFFFKYIRNNKIKLIITQHDCWTFTGHCPYFTLHNCEKWKSKCTKCQFYREYPQSNWDNSAFMFELKKNNFLSVDLTLVSVSKWLANESQKSFLGHNPTYVISNGINLNIFKPRTTDIVENKYNLHDSFILFGCATGWSERKGLDDYIKLCDLLRDDEIIVVVGLRKDQIKNAPAKLKFIERTEDQIELSALYSRANVLLSLSKAETFGLTIIESMACGTPVVIYNNTAQPELVNDKNGRVAENGDIKSVRKCIDEIRNMPNDFFYEGCMATALKYEESRLYSKYVDLMESLIKK